MYKVLLFKLGAIYAKGLYRTNSSLHLDMANQRVRFLGLTDSINKSMYYLSLFLQKHMRKTVLLFPFDHRPISPHQ